MYNSPIKYMYTNNDMRSDAASAAAADDDDVYIGG